MTGTVPAPAGRKGTSTGPGPAGRIPIPWLRRHRALAALAGVVAVALGLVVWGQLAPKGDRIPLSVHNAGPEGSRAVAQILGRHGVEVHEAADFEAAMAALAAGSSPTLLLYDNGGFLAEPRLRDLAGAARRVVVVSPRLQTLAGLGAGTGPDSIRQAGVVPDGLPALEAACPLPDAQAAGQVTGQGGFVYDGGTSCFRLPGSPAGLLAVTDNGRLSVLGSTAVLSNERLHELGNAALALRLLGASPDLVWYLPSLGDLETEGAPQTLDELAPEWARFIGLWLVLVALAAVAWRGRRLGPLVFEPLPVVVKAVETAEGRARLYQDSHAVDQARDNLRAGTLVRLARELRLGPGTTPGHIAGAAARPTGRKPSDILELINQHPRTEARLVAWSQELENLEKEVKADE